jgi:6-pyruvoyltetrahydropterin/6-carboxytetrahydropterin synthase
MYRVTKTLRWEAAHRLVDGYQGNCSFVHGHSWVAEVTLESDALDGYGFVFDFNGFQPLKDFVCEHLDHSAMVNVRDFRWLEWLRENEQKVFVFPCNPTSENIACLLFEKAQQFLGDALSSARVVQVVVQETCTGRAIYAR